MVSRCPFVVSIFVLRSTAFWSESVADEALEVDDECSALAGGSLESCAVNHLQLRAGTKAIHAATPDAVKEARRRPLYCDSLQGTSAASPWCLGESTCRCESYCEHGMSKESWDFEPDCCSCTASSLGMLQAGTEILSKAGSEPLKALDHPLYCRNAKLSVAPSVYCKGASTCKCSAHCKQVSARAWGWDPTCCGCSSASFLQAVGAALAPASLHHQAQRQPRFCKFLPSTVQTPTCLLEVSTCLCSSHCNTDVPISHWAWHSTCCGCQVVLQTTAQEKAKDREQEEQHEQPAELAGKQAELLKLQAGPLSRPLYCRSMPNDGADSPWCAGATSCSCQDHCSLAVPPASWGWDPLCCACSAAANTGSSLLPPSHQIEPNVSQGGLENPLFCQQLPIGTTSIWCEGSIMCGCEAYCLASVLPESWGWDPQCCGCGDEAKEASKKAIKALPESTLPAEREHPLYCDYLANASKSPHCRENGTCTCLTYCKAAVQPTSWAWDPGCCGCDSDDVPQGSSSSHDSSPSEGEGDDQGDEESSDGHGHRPDSMSPGGAAVPRQQPSHCDAVPPFLALPWCTPGQKTCVCEAYCQLSVSPSTWASDPNCCDCTLSMIPAATPPTHPLYCEHLPTDIKLPWCQGLHGCSCQSFCASAVAPTQWGWDSQCCACRYSDIFAAKAPAKARSLETPPDEGTAAPPRNMTTNSSKLLVPVLEPSLEPDPVAASDSKEEEKEVFSFDQVTSRWRRCAAWRNPRCQRLGANGRCLVWGSRQCIRWSLLQESDARSDKSDAAARVPSFCNFLETSQRPPSCLPASAAALSSTASCGCDATCAFIPQASHEWTTACCGCRT